MSREVIGIVMNGVTGRMGYRQRLVRSILAIREQGGLALDDGGFFGRILSVRGEFGYWVFEGDWQAAQRPSWSHRAEPAACRGSGPTEGIGARAFRSGAAVGACGRPHSLPGT